MRHPAHRTGTVLVEIAEGEAPNHRGELGGVYYEKRRSKREYKAGITRSVTKVERVSPPITARARGFCNSAPEPRPTARGINPKSVQRVVIRIGRTRIFPAATSASRRGIPCSSHNLCTYSKRMMPFFTTSPTIRMIPMNEETFSAVPVANSMAKTPRTDSGAADMMIKAGGKARN